MEKMQRTALRPRLLLICLLVLALGLGITAFVQAGAARASQESPDHGMPPEWPGFYKSASQTMLAPGETLTYTIHMNNPTPAVVTATVTDPLPFGLVYVDGSVTGGGGYNPSTRTLTWSQVAVTPGSTVELTFQVMQAPTDHWPMPVTNKARFQVGNLFFERSVTIQLVPEPPTPPSALSRSMKTASRWMLAPTQTLTYTIHLVNEGNTPTLVTVTDTVPSEVAYVDGSATGGGVYDAATSTLSWSAVSVPPMGRVKLTFQVTPAVEVSGLPR